VKDYVWEVILTEIMLQK